jgi:hypothetical protein
MRTARRGKAGKTTLALAVAATSNGAVNTHPANADRSSMTILLCLAHYAAQLDASL